MLNFFFSNLPEVFSKRPKAIGRPNFIPTQVVKLKTSVAKVTGIDPAEIEFYTTNVKYNLLENDGYNHAYTPIRVVVGWNSRRSLATKRAIAEALLVFFRAHSLYKGLTIIFHDSDTSTSFVEEDDKVILTT